MELSRIEEFELPDDEPGIVRYRRRLETRCGCLSDDLRAYHPAI
jgi:hypothetical protein